MSGGQLTLAKASLPITSKQVQYMKSGGRKHLEHLAD